MRKNIAAACRAWVLVGLSFRLPRSSSTTRYDNGAATSYSSSLMTKHEKEAFAPRRRINLCHFLFIQGPLPVSCFASVFDRPVQIDMSRRNNTPRRVLANNNTFFCLRIWPYPLSRGFSSARYDTVLQSSYFLYMIACCKNRRAMFLIVLFVFH